MTSPGPFRTVFRYLHYVCCLSTFVLRDWVSSFSLSADRITVVKNGRHSHTRFYLFVNGRNNTFGRKVHYKIELYCFMSRNLSILGTICILLVPLSLTVLEVEINVTPFISWSLSLFIEDMERLYVIR